MHSCSAHSEKKVAIMSKVIGCTQAHMVVGVSAVTKSSTSTNIMYTQRAELRLS